MEVVRRLKRVLSRISFLRRFYYTSRLDVDLPRLKLDANSLRGISVANRQVLASVNQWIDDDTYRNSIFRYGLPEHIRPFIDEPIDLRPSYSDLIVYLAKKIPGKVSYLEIGPSVGKNLLQVLSAVSDAEIVALDLEDINPALARQLVEIESAEWASGDNFMRKRPGKRSEFEFGGNRNRLTYVAGDVFDPATWKQLEGRSFNLVFSDAFHSGQALATEWDHISRMELMDPRGFTMAWDDLASEEMRDAFATIVRAMKGRYGSSRVVAHLEFFQGWVGRHAPLHPIGIARLLPVQSGPGS